MDDDILILSDHAWIMTQTADQSAIDQVKDFIKHPAFADKKARFMPDIHAGAGCVIGTTVQLGQYIVPNIIGVDIGCGVLAVELGPINIDYKKLHQFIVKHIPNGCVNHKSQSVELPQRVYELMLKEFRQKKIESFPNTFKQFQTELEQAAGTVSANVTTDALGTLGGGNHFIEIDMDEKTENKYLVIHSGSRNFGLKVASYYQNLANYLLTADNNEQQSTIKKIKPKKGANIKKMKQFAEYAKPYPDDIKQLGKGFSKDMAFLMGEHAKNYTKHMTVAQIFALLNRRIMAHRIIKHLGWGLKYENCNLIESVHNYIDFQDNMIRKGAIAARKDELVVIPLNMADGTLIGRGKGNDEWNHSAPHGAGRVFARSVAKKNISMDEFRDSMKHVWSECVDKNTLDEAPQAYKNAEYIKKRIEPSVEIMIHLKSVFNFKSGVEAAV